VIDWGRVKAAAPDVKDLALSQWRPTGKGKGIKASLFGWVNGKHASIEVTVGSSQVAHSEDLSRDLTDVLVEVAKKLNPSLDAAFPRTSDMDRGS
jgi:hypothetical protein